jgi:hypothetical protein
MHLQKKIVDGEYVDISAEVEAVEKIITWNSTYS